MAFVSGTMAYDGTTMCQTFIDTLSTSMLANGYTLVETYTSSGYGKVWKSALANNTMCDFYITAWASGVNTGPVYFGVAEDYDAGTHALKKYAPYAGATYVPNYNTSVPYDYTVANAAGALLTANTTYEGVPLTVDYYSYQYWFSINPKRVHICTRVGLSDYGVYVGQGENLISPVDHPSSAVCLLVSLSGASGRTLNSNPYTTGTSFTREPGQTSTGNGNWGGAICNALTWPYYSGHDSLDWRYKPGFNMARIPVHSNTDPSALYVPRALLLAGHLHSPRAAGVNGDTISLGGKTYVHMTLGYPGTYHCYVDNSL